jgi:hypothetical protein
VRCLDPEADTALLEGMESELRRRFEAEPNGNLMRLLSESLSLSVQMTEAKAYLAESLPAGMEELMRLYVEPPPREKTQRLSGRAAIQAKMRTEFERAGVWELMRKRIAASEYTRPGDPLRIDVGYRPNGVSHPADKDPFPHPNEQKSLVGDPESAGTPELGTRLHFLFFRIVVVACLAPIAACAIAGFADFLFRGQFIAFAGDGHGVHSFGILTEGIAIDILRGDLESVEEQASAARIEAGAEQPSCNLGDRYLDGGGILQQREIDVIPVGAFRFGHGMHAGVEITICHPAESRRLAS